MSLLLFKIFFIYSAISGVCECSGLPLEFAALPMFPETGRYEFAYSGVSTTKFAVPRSAEASYGLGGLVTVYTGPSLATPQGDDLLVQLTDLKHSIYSGDGRTDEDMQYQEMQKDTAPLSQPFLVHIVSGAVVGLSVDQGEPLWSLNIKRSLAAALQLQIQGRDLPGAFKISEPCLHGMCAAEYSSADGRVIRRSNGVPTLQPSPSHRLWVSVMPNVCAKDIKNPLVGNVERWYTLDENGLSKISSIGSIEIHYHKHIYQSLTNITLERIRITKDVAVPKIAANKVKVGLAWQPPPPEDETGGRHVPAEGDKMKTALQILAQIAGGLEIHGPQETLIKEKLPLRLQRVMATMSFEELKHIFEELELGTSYNRETMRNIFVEAVPHSGTKAGALLSRDLITQQKLDVVSALRLLQAMPFGVQQLDERLLAELQPLLQLGQEHNSLVRHSAIMAFASVVNRAMLAGGCSSDMFEEYVQRYFSRFTESPDYADRLVWLMGLSNLQVERVTRYLTPVVSGALGHSAHERFLAVWAALPLAHLHPHETHNIYWPMLQNELEPLELRVAALTMLLLAEPSPHRLMSIFWYVNGQSCGHIKHFFYTTIKSLQHTTYDCYAHLAKLSSYLSMMVKPTDSRFWATGNYLLDGSDVERDMGGMIQVFSVAEPRTGLPNIFYLTSTAHNAGLVIAEFAIYIKLQGLSSIAMRRLMDMGITGLSVEHLEQALKDHKKWKPKSGAPLHIEVVIKHQGKAVLALHVNQTMVDKWTQGNLINTVNSFIKAESHVNNQFVAFPTLLTSVLPSEMGTPVSTDTMLASLTSLRGNLTHSMSVDDISRKNDIHFRTSSLALLKLSSYNPMADTTHSVEVSQVTDLYLPVNFSFGGSLRDKTFKTSWMLPGGDQIPGLSAYSGARISLYPPKNVLLSTICKNCQQNIPLKTFKDVFNMRKGRSSLSCEGISTIPQILWQLIHSHQSNTQIMPLSKIALIGIHMIALGTVPAEGVCYMSLSPSVDSPEALWLDTEMAILPSTASNKVQIKADIIRRNATTGDQLTKLTTNWMSDSMLRMSRIAGKISWTDSYNQQPWKMCLDARRNFDESNSKHSSELVASWGEDSSVCPKTGQLYFFMEVAPEDKQFNVSFSTTNIPEYIRNISQHTQLLLETLAKDDNGELGALSLISGQLAKQEANVTAYFKENQEIMELYLEGLSDAKAIGLAMPYESFLPIVHPHPQQYFLSSIGFTRKCSIVNNEIYDVENTAKNILNKDEILLLGDCTRLHRYAITVSLGSSNKINLYAGEHLVNVDTLNDTLSVVFNGKNVSWENFRYPESENFYDIKMLGTKDSVIIHTKLGGLELNVKKNNELTVEFPANHLEIACGACVNQHDQYFHC